MAVSFAVRYPAARPARGSGEAEEGSEMTGAGEQNLRTFSVCAMSMMDQARSTRARRAIASGPIPQQPPIPRAPRFRHPATVAAGNPSTPAPRHS